jgi:glycosyltransferase involved in cell wall biosynthesis
MTRLRRLRVLVDITQYVNRPAMSGVQRVLRHLAENWSGHRAEALFGFLEGDLIVSGPFSDVGSIIAETFREADPTAPAETSNLSAMIKQRLDRVAIRRVPVAELKDRLHAYLLAEPTFRGDNLTLGLRLQHSQRTTPFYLYYDALPLTDPQFFPGLLDGRVAVTRYHLAMTAADNIAFISRAIREEFENRIARRRPPNARVVRPGADGLRRVSQVLPSRPTFVMLGTIEPRKRHEVVVDAFERLWARGRDYRLLILGPARAGQEELLSRIRLHSRTGRVSWIEHPDDDLVADTLGRCSAMVFPSEGEGYGLPPLEALALGTPVVVASRLPALEDLPEHGQIRLTNVTVEAVTSAVEIMADNFANAAYRHAIGDLRLPTWREFAADLEAWIASVIDGGYGNHTPQRSP